MQISDQAVRGKNKNVFRRVAYSRDIETVN